MHLCDSKGEMWQFIWVFFVSFMRFFFNNSESLR